MLYLYDSYAEFGPLFSTTNADEIKSKIAEIKPNGGDDTPEMCLSGLQVRTPKNNIVTFMLISPMKETDTKHKKITKALFLAVGSHWCS